MNSSRSGQGQVAGSYEHGNEPYGSNQYRKFLNPLNAKLNPICHLLALLEAHHILHISRIRVNYLSNFSWKTLLYGVSH